ncbi:MAG: STAS domain-containing protein [Vicinamibacterales bacterium]
MTLNERRIGDITLLDLKGRLVLEDGDALLRTRINELIEQGRLRLVLNLKEVTYVDSCGVGVLIAKLVSMRNKGGDLRLLNLTERSRRLMEISQLLNVFAIFDAESDAVASFVDQTGA